MDLKLSQNKNTKAGNWWVRDPVHRWRAWTIWTVGVGILEWIQPDFCKATHIQELQKLEIMKMNVCLKVGEVVGSTTNI